MVSQVSWWGLYLTCREDKLIAYEIGVVFEYFRLLHLQLLCDLTQPQQVIVYCHPCDSLKRTCAFALMNFMFSQCFQRKLSQKYWWDRITRIVYFVCAAMAPRSISIFSVSWWNKQIFWVLTAVFQGSLQYRAAQVSYVGVLCQSFYCDFFFFNSNSLHLCSPSPLSLPWRRPAPPAWPSGCCPLCLAGSAVWKRSRRWTPVCRDIWGSRREGKLVRPELWVSFHIVANPTKLTGSSPTVAPPGCRRPDSFSAFWWTPCRIRWTCGPGCPGFSPACRDEVGVNGENRGRACVHVIVKRLSETRPLQFVGGGSQEPVNLWRAFPAQPPRCRQLAHARGPDQLGRAANPDLTRGKLAVSL